MESIRKLVSNSLFFIFGRSFTYGTKWTMVCTSNSLSTLAVFKFINSEVKTPLLE